MNYPSTISGNSAVNTPLSDTATPNQQRKAGMYTADDVLWEIKERRTHTGKHFHMRNGTDIAV
ncbi:MAG: hypothetical protein IKY08_02945, partial [Firmicutes bacterium]|nr:hypothetical protein [Bacillota bacterium]